MSHVDIVERHLAHVRLDHTAGDAKTGRFSGSVGTEQADDLPFLDLEIDPIDHLAAAVSLDQSFDLQDGHGEPVGC